MKSEERREKIYNILKFNKEISVAALSEQFGVSSMTIRRDLNSLEHSNLVNRSYGKAHIIDESRQEFSFQQRSQVNKQLKQKIARTALSYLTEVSSFYVDGSTTATEVLKILPSSHTYTVFTNSFEALKILSEKPWIRTYAVGGFLGKDHNTFDDDTTIDIVKQIFVEATITSCSGFSQNGIFNDGITGTQIKRIMLANSAQNFILADHTKANSQGLFLLSSWESLHYLITDAPVDAKCLETIKSFGVQVRWE